MHKYKKKGISIIELSIIIAIMGMFSMMLLSGRYLILNAKVRGIISKITEYEKIVFEFKATYDYLPGDFPKTHVWSNKEVSSCNRVLNVSLTNKDIAGDGDGYVMPENSNGNGKVYEGESVVCHIFLGGFLSERYVLFTTIFDKNTHYSTINDKYSAGIPIDSENGLVLIGDNYKESNNHDSYINGNGIYLKKIFGLPAAFMDNLTIKPNSTNILMAIDSKIDDGKPGSGKIVLANKKGNLCTKNNGKICADGSDVVDEDNPESYLIYRPRWLNNNW